MTDANSIYYSNKNLKHLFKLFFELSIDVPKDLLESEGFKDVRIFDEVGITSIPEWKKNLKNEPEGFFDFNQWEHKPDPDELYENWLVSGVFGKNSSIL
jgi:hypothetical protein